MTNGEDLFKGAKATAKVGAEIEPTKPKAPPEPTAPPAPEVPPVSPLAEEPWFVRAGMAVSPKPAKAPTATEPGMFEFTLPDEPLDYDKESTKYYSQLEAAHKNLEYMSKKLETFTAFQATPVQIATRLTPGIGISVARNRDYLVDIIKVATDDVEKNEYFFKLANWLPSIVAAPDSEFKSVDDVLSKLAYPDSLTAEELDIAKALIQAILDREALGPPLDMSAEELLAQAKEGLPLTIPKDIGPEELELAAVHNLAVSDLVKSFQVMTKLSAVMSPEEWEAFMADEGYSDADLEAIEQARQQAESLVADWQDTQGSLDAFKSGLAEIPDYTLTNMLKDFWVQPGLALLEAVNIYREHVSMPMAGQAWRHLYPDLEAEYQRLRKSESSWVAAREALQNWDTHWAFKYLLLESITDPLSYVGWGIATRALKHVPVVGGKLAAINRGAMELLDVPFDLVKAGWRRIPKTIGQRAMAQQHQSGQLTHRAIELYTGKPLATCTMAEFSKARTALINFYLKHPQSEDIAALAGKEFLLHIPVDAPGVVAMSRALGVEMVESQVTRQVASGADDIFEDYFFRHIVSKDEAAAQLLKVLSIDRSKVTLRTAGSMLDARGQTILRRAIELDAAASPHQALRILMRRNYDIAYDTEKSLAYLARANMGNYATILDGIAVRAQRLWADKIDKFVVKPFAEAYLTFGMYGPMNVMEDYVRSALGGVVPRKMNIESWERLSWGLVTDVNLERYGISEMIGYLERAGSASARSNWVLQAATLGKKSWSAKTYDVLVRRPGAVGMDVRRNFVAGRYKQILEDMGGDAIQKMAGVGPRLPRVISGKLKKQLEAEVYRAKLSGNPEVVRGLKEVFTTSKLTRAEVQNILSEYPDIPQAVRQHIIKAHDSKALWKNIDGTIDEARNLLADDFIRSPEVATQQVDELAKMLTEMKVKNPEDMAWAMQQLQVMCDTYGALPHQIMSQSSIRTRRLPINERQAAIDTDFMRIQEFLDKSGISIDNVITDLRKKLLKTGAEEDYITKTDRVLDIIHTRIEAAAEFRSMNMASRHEIFAKTPRKMRDETFWDDFYTTMDSQYAGFEKADAQLFGMLEVARETADTAAGAKLLLRKPVVVADRPLAPADVARLMQCRGDDISRALMEVMIVNSKPRFTEYILSRVRPGDVGFTREAIERVYDQVVHSLYSNPETFSAITKSQMQISAVGKELHNLQVAKQYSDDILKPMHKYIDDQAAALDGLMYTTRKVPRVAELETAYRGGTLRRTTGVAATEGEGLYISSSREFAKGYGKVTKIEYAKPKKPLIVAATDELPVIQESKWLMEPITSADSVWVRLNKQARIDLGLTDTNFQKYVAKFNTRLTELISGEGYDAIKVMKGAPAGVSRPEYMVLVDEALWRKPPKPPIAKVLKPEFENWQTVRQDAMDKAHKWYYKEYPDYTNANAFDAMMKTIYPFWTYESSRWFWLPRSFIRHPGTLTAFERFQDNTDYGYIHIPGTSADINPFRGTIYGTVTTRLIRRDYPEYYDSLPVAGDFIEGMDFLSRFGFYPGAHFSIPLAMAGGLESQLGETLPSIHRTLLNVLIAEFPDSSAVKGLTELVFNDRFRDYATILQVNRRGGEGIKIWTKQQEGVSLTESEEAVWTDARREAALYGIAFEQFGLFRMRSDEQYAAYKQAAIIIEEKTGITEQQQHTLRRRGERIWDIVGGLSPTNQAVLQSLDYYKWVGLNKPLLPSRQQLILNKQTLFWEDVENYSNKKNEEMLQLQLDFRSGAIGPGDYIDGVGSVYRDRREYIDTLHESVMYKDVPVTLEERKQYFEATGNPMPVQHPMKELLNLLFEIQPEEVIDPETGEKQLDWDTFWGMRNAIDAAIPDRYKQEWNDYLSRNSTPYEIVRREINESYFRPYNRVYDAILGSRSEEERRLIEEYMYLERTEQDRARQEAIRDVVGADGKKLISSFRSDISAARKALRYANPTLDAWLNFWGRVHSFITPEAEAVYNQIQTQMQRK